MQKEIFNKIGISDTVRLKEISLNIKYTARFTEPKSTRILHFQPYNLQGCVSASALPLAISAALAHRFANAS